MNNKNQHLFNHAYPLVNKIFEKRGMGGHLIKIVEMWDTIVGSKYKSFCYPHKINWDKNNNAILVINVTNNGVHALISHESKKIIANINSYFGYNCINKLQLNKLI